MEFQAEFLKNSAQICKIPNGLGVKNTQRK